jgi:hypothetical protein
MNTKNNARLTKLQCTFPKLTEENQQYVFGLTEGLRYAQNKVEENPGKQPLGDKDKVKIIEIDKRSTL